MDNNKIRIIIADDHPFFRGGIRTEIERTNFATIVGEAENGQQVLKLLEYNECDIVILDIRMPVMDGVETTRILIRKYPDIKIIIMTAFEDEERFHELLSNGVKGFLHKDIEPADIQIALKEVMIGNIYLSRVFQMVVCKFYISSNKTAIHLTNREIDVLEKIIEGHSNKEIALILKNSLRTIESHKYRILKKTGTKNSSELKSFAIKNNIILRKKR